MEREIKKEIELLKVIKPDEEWKSDLRASLFGEPTFLVTSISFNQMVAGLVLTGVVIFMIAFNLSNDYLKEINRLEITQLNPKPKVVTVMEVDKDEETLNRLITEVELENLSEVEKLKLAQESVQAILNEIKEVEERLVKIRGMK